MPDSLPVKILAATTALLAAAALSLTACSSMEDASSLQTTAASSSASTYEPPTFPAFRDGSVITAGGYVFKGDFAICNKATCGSPSSNGTVQCTCDLETDEWTLSPIPKTALETLAERGTVVSTFTTVNVANAGSVKCTVGQWADCYGALCTPNDDGTATCTCPVSDDESVEWMKYVDSCTGADVGCTADTQSVAPLFKKDPSLDAYLAVVEQAGDTVPGIPQACKVPSE
jgi:hypothetical protein